MQAHGSGPWVIVAGVDLSVLGAVWLAGRAFRLGMLRHGQRLRWSEALQRQRGGQSPAMRQTLLVNLLGNDAERLARISQPMDLKVHEYPLHLHGKAPADRQAPALDRLASAVYEDAFPWGTIELQEPLHAWLRARLPA